MIYTTNSKLLHYDINCDYHIPYEEKDLQTNTLISKTLNIFLNKYNTLFNTHTFILYNNDDLMSLINYVILCRIRGLTDFNFKIWNKPKRLKHFFGKQEHYVSSKFIKNNLCIIINSDNPIYKVDNDITKSKTKLYYETISLFPNEPTPDEIFIMELYFQLGLTNTLINPNNHKLIAFNNWCDSPFEFIYTPHLINFLTNQKPTISCIWISGDNEKDNLILQQIEQADTIAFYFYEKDEIPSILLDKTFNFLLKRKTNIPCKEYGNLNNIELCKKFINEKYNVEFFGEWNSLVAKRYEEELIQ